MFLIFFSLIMLSTVYSEYIPLHLHRSLTYHFSYSNFLFYDKNFLIHSLHFSCKILIYELENQAVLFLLGVFLISRLILVLLPLLLIVPGLFSFLICPLQLPIIVMFPYVSLGVHNARRGRQLCGPHIPVLILWLGSDPFNWKIHQHRNYVHPVFHCTCSAYHRMLNIFLLN